MIENEESNRNRDSTRVEQEIDQNTHEPEDYVYKKQLRYHDAREQDISRKFSDNRKVVNNSNYIDTHLLTSILQKHDDMQFSRTMVLHKRWV